MLSHINLNSWTNLVRIAEEMMPIFQLDIDSVTINTLLSQTSDRQAFQERNARSIAPAERMTNKPKKSFRRFELRSTSQNIPDREFVPNRTDRANLYRTKNQSSSSTRSQSTTTSSSDHDHRDLYSKCYDYQSNRKAPQRFVERSERHKSHNSNDPRMRMTVKTFKLITSVKERIARSGTTNVKMFTSIKSAAYQIICFMQHSTWPVVIGKSKLRLSTAKRLRL
jgi:hypothetical protein